MRTWLVGSLVLLLAIVPACAGGNGLPHPHGDAGVGDAGDAASAFVTVTVPQIQNPDAAGHVAVGAQVRVVSAIVTALDTFEENGTGMGRVSDVWIADPAGGPWSGVQVFMPTVTTCAGSTMLARGDTVDVQGSVREDADPSDGSGRTVTQIFSATITCRTIGDGIGPAAAPITDARMLADDAMAEPWEGVVVELTSIDAAGATDTMGSQALRDAPPLDDDLYRFMGTRRDHFDAIRGVFTYEIGRWELLPRAASDVTLGTPRMIEDGAGAWGCADGADSDGDGAVDCADADCSGSPFCAVAVVTVQDLQDATHTAHPAVGTSVALVGPLTVTSVDGFAEMTGPGYIGTIVVQDATATDARFSGIHVFVPRVEACGGGGALALGDQVYVAGTYAEYAASGDTSTRTEIENGLVSCRAPGTALAPTPIAMPSDLAAAATAEPLEGVLVSIGGVSVTMPAGTYGRFQVTGGVYVDDDVYRATVGTGDALSQIIGVLTYSFGYQLEPRMASDVVVGPTERDDASCGNGLDDDGDGHADCEDVDCCATAPCMGALATRRLVLSEVLYDVAGGGATGDDGHEWVEIRNAGTSAVPISCYTLGNGTTSYRYSFTQLPASSIPAGGCILVGGPDCGGPACTDTINFNPDLHNVPTGGAAGVALLYGLATSITDATVPVDAVIYGDANTGGLLDASGTAPSATMVPTVTAGHSIARTDTGGWADTTPPTPGTCTTYTPP